MTTRWQNAAGARRWPVTSKAIKDIRYAFRNRHWDGREMKQNILDKEQRNGTCIEKKGNPKKRKRLETDVYRSSNNVWKDHGYQETRSYDDEVDNSDKDTQTRDLLDHGTKNEVNQIRRRRTEINDDEKKRRRITKLSHQAEISMREKRDRDDIERIDAKMAEKRKKKKKKKKKKKTKNRNGENKHHDVKEEDETN